MSEIVVRIETLEHICQLYIAHPSHQHKDIALPVANTNTPIPTDIHVYTHKSHACYMPSPQLDSSAVIGSCLLVPGKSRPGYVKVWP